MTSWCGPASARPNPVGKLLLYPGGVFNGQPPVGPCASGTSGPLPLSMPVDTSFAPGKGSQIVMIDRRYALLVGRRDKRRLPRDLRRHHHAGGNRVPTRLSAPITLPDLRTAAVLDTGAAKYVVAGYPGSMSRASRRARCSCTRST